MANTIDADNTIKVSELYNNSKGIDATYLYAIPASFKVSADTAWNSTAVGTDELKSYILSYVDTKLKGDNLISLSKTGNTHNDITVKCGIKGIDSNQQNSRQRCVIYSDYTDPTPHYLTLEDLKDKMRISDSVTPHITLSGKDGIAYLIQDVDSIPNNLQVTLINNSDSSLSLSQFNQKVYISYSPTSQTTAAMKFVVKVSTNDFDTAVNNSEETDNSYGRIWINTNNTNIRKHLQSLEISSGMPNDSALTLNFAKNTITVNDQYTYTYYTFLSN